MEDNNEDRLSDVAFGQCPLAGFEIDDLVMFEHRLAWGAKKLLAVLPPGEHAPVIAQQLHGLAGRLSFRNGAAMSIIQDVILREGEASQSSRNIFEIALDAPDVSGRPFVVHRDRLAYLISQMIEINGNPDRVVSLDPDACPA